MARDHKDDSQSDKPANTELSSLYSQLKSEEPSAAVDRYLLHAAKKAVSKKKSSAGNPFNGDWRMPAALAAVLVLAVGITLTLEKTSRPQPERYERVATSETPKSEKPAIQHPNTKTKSSKTSEKLTKPRRAEPAELAATEPSTNLSREATGSSQEVTRHSQTGLASPSPSAESETRLKDSMQTKTLDSTDLPANSKDIDTTDTTKSAEQWVDLIRALIKESKLTEARKQLTEFQRKYPNYKLPEDLEALKTQGLK